MKQPQNKITAIGFDFGGVIEGQPGSVFDRGASKVLGISLQEFKKAYATYKKLINENLISREDFWRKVLAEVDQSVKFNDFMEYLQTRPPKNINKDVLEIVDSLRENGYKVGILSNNDLAARGIFIKKGVIEHFDTIVISAEVGYSKPDTKAFELFFDELGCRADQCVFIDDSEGSLTSAKEVGFHSIVFTDSETLRMDLKKLGIIL